MQSIATSISKANNIYSKNNKNPHPYKYVLCLVHLNCLIICRFNV